MSEKKHATMGERIQYLKDEITKREKNLKDAIRIDSHPCYATGFYEGHLVALRGELEFLEFFYKKPLYG